MMKAVTRFFSSVKLAIVLLIILTLASILGTLIPQGRSAAEYTARYGQISNLLIRMEITYLYHSWWFLGLLFFISINTIVCTLTRFKSKLKKTLRPKLEFESKMLNSFKVSQKFTINKGIEKTKERLKELLILNRFHTREKAIKGRVFLMARKHVFGIFGSDVVHLGLLIIFLGGILSGLLGFKSNLQLTEGQVLKIPKADFSLKLDKFETEYYESGQVRDWKSTLTVIENKKEIFTKKIEVNHPLSYKGFMFYQSRWGWDWENPSVNIVIKDQGDTSNGININLKIGNKTILKDKNLEIHALHFVPDFVLNDRNQVTTRSLQPNNPAAFIKAVKDGEELFSGWIFSKFPDFIQQNSQKENGLSFRFADFKTKHYSGIQMTKDPGANCIWIGCVILMFGLFVAFYWTSREIKILMEEKKGSTSVIMGGLAPKNRESFRVEFDKITKNLRR